MWSSGDILDTPPGFLCGWYAPAWSVRYSSRVQNSLLLELDLETHVFLVLPRYEQALPVSFLLCTCCGGGGRGLCFFIRGRL